MKRVLKWSLVVIIALIVASVFLPKSQNNATQSVSAPPSHSASPPSTQVVVEPLSVTALALYDAYDRNEVAADDKYKGKLLAVSGTVQSIDKDAFDNIIVALKSRNEFVEVRAHLEKDHAATASSLEKGQKILLVCTGDGRLIGSPVLRDCSPRI